jgi:hypothetical protein
MAPPVFTSSDQEILDDHKSESINHGEDDRSDWMYNEFFEHITDFESKIPCESLSSPACILI